MDSPTTNGDIRQRKHRQQQTSSGNTDNATSIYGSIIGERNPWCNKKKITNVETQKEDKLDMDPKKRE